MYILEHKKLYIVPEPLRKNCCCQSYHWEQVCMCSDRSVLEEAITKRRNPKEWRITETAKAIKNVIIPQKVTLEVIL